MGFLSKNNKMMQPILPVSTLYENQVVVMTPHSSVLKRIARSAFLAIAIISFLWIMNTFYQHENRSADVNMNGSLQTLVQNEIDIDTTILPIRETSSQATAGKRRLLAYESDAKRVALNGLEDVILEPPRGSSTYRKYLRNTKYLPELTGDTLDGYPRRVFIDVALPGKSGSSASTEWFKKNYPTRNRLFDIFNIEMVADESTVPQVGVPQVGVSEWLRKNVKEEEYVVMKAEADVVEEMISSRAIILVDEMFLECNHQWQRGKKNKGKRAYWECLALYGRLRDEGVAVHQWWG